MAAEESSQGAALGPEFSEPAGGDPPARRDIPDLHDVLGEFLEALCVLEMIHRALQELMEESSEVVGSYAMALRHAFQMLDAVYSRFDLGLLGYDGPERDDSDDDHDDDDDNGDDDESAGRDGRDTRASAVADDDGASGLCKPRPELHPGYGAAITVQAGRLQDVRSILDCAKYALTNDPEEVDVTGAVTAAHQTVDDVIDQLDSVSLRKSAEKWLADEDAAALVR